jgi:hypothetical protein
MTVLVMLKEPWITGRKIVVIVVVLDCCELKLALMCASGLSTNGGSISPPFTIANTLTLLPMMTPHLSSLIPHSLIPEPDLFLPSVLAEAALIVHTVPAIDDLEYR